MNGSDSNNGQKECLNCKNTFLDKSKNKGAKCCSERCSTAFRNSRKFEGKAEGYDFIECPECNQKVAEVSLLHAKMHGFSSVKEMATHFGMKKLKCQRLIDGMSGKNNPGYNHGGSLSPWSEKSGKSKEEISFSKKAAKDNSRGNKPNNLDHYLRKGYTLEESMNLLRANQSNGLDKMKKLYGDATGLKRWQERQISWQATLNAKPEEEKQRINKAKMSNGYSISKKEIELLESIKQHVPEVIDQFYLKKDAKGYSYDFACGDKIVEFFGDFWHHNPEIYSIDWVNPYTKMTSSQKWLADKNRIKAAEDLGYKVLVVWESEWVKNKNEVIKRCINFLKP